MCFRDVCFEDEKWIEYSQVRVKGEASMLVALNQWPVYWDSWLVRYNAITVLNSVHYIRILQTPHQAKLCCHYT